MKKIAFVFLLMLIVIGIGAYYWKFEYTYSSGYRAGLLQKFSYRGNLFKTYEGEMILSSVHTTTDLAIASEKFHFSVNDKELARQLEQLQGEDVVVHYHEKNGTLIWRGDSRYIVDSVTTKKDAGRAE